MMFRNNKRGVETLTVVVTVILLLATAAVILAIGPKNIFKFGNTTAELMSCGGFPGSPTHTTGVCKTANECKSGNWFKLGCTGSGQGCCFEEKENAGSGVVDPALVPEELKNCYTQNPNCEDKCKVGLKDVSVRGSAGKDGYTYLGNDRPITVTVTVDKLYDYAASNCVTVESISFGPVESSGSTKYSDKFSCVKKHVENDWVSFECRVYCESRNGCGWLWDDKNYRFEVRIKSDECKCKNDAKALLKYDFKGNFE